MSFFTRTAGGGFLSGLLLLLTTLGLLIASAYVPDDNLRTVIWFLIGIFGFTATSLLADTRRQERDPRESPRLRSSG